MPSKEDWQLSARRYGRHKKIDDSVIVTDEKRIIGLRHILVHDYDYIDDPTIWKICQNNLPILKKEVLNLIEEQRNIE